MVDAAHELLPIRSMIWQPQPRRLLAFAWCVSPGVCGPGPSEKEIADRFALWCWPGAGPADFLGCLSLAKRLILLVPAKGFEPLTP